MGKLITVVGGQFGSEGKGAIAGYLGSQDQAGANVLGVRVAGPNAGHTVYDVKGREFKLQQVPVVAATNFSAKLLIAAGSEIDWNTLNDELLRLDLAGHQARHRLSIDPEATVIEEHHVWAERGTQTATHERSGATVLVPLEHGQGGITKSIGSTGKGIGAARADRIMRKAKRVTDWDPGTLRVQGELLIEDYLQDLNGTVLIEGTQGYGLGLHAGYYPYCTSSDCRAIDFMGMAGVSPWNWSIKEQEVWVVLRTYPIRVAGNSGPMYDEQDWGTLAEVSGGHIQPERTTVTKKVRRIGGWDAGLAHQAVVANGGGWRPVLNSAYDRRPSVVKVALTFCDYWWPHLYKATEMPQDSDAIWSRIHRIQQEIGAPIELLGTGPQTVIDLREERAKGYAK